MSALSLIIPKVNAQDIDPAATVTFKFQTINFSGDVFTQLLGINKDNVIAGYHGSGATGHPNKGFVLTLPNHFALENFPGSVQTQVIGINDAGSTDGFYVDTKGINHGFLNIGSTFETRDYPGTTFNQLLGLNNENQASGFYADAKGIDHGFIFYQNGGAYLVLQDGHAPGGMQVTGTNNVGASCGFYVDGAGVNHAFLLAHGALATLNFPNSTSTQAFGINDSGEIVGTYTDKGGLIHGFIYKGGTFQEVDDPSGVGMTLINGVNNAGWIVGFYGNCATGGPDCHGFVGTPE